MERQQDSRSPFRWETLYKPTRIRDSSSSSSSTTYRSSRRRASQICINVCCIYLFVAAAIVCIAFLIFGLYVFRLKTPTVKITSVVIRNLSYGFSPNPFMAANLIAQMTMENSNFGKFKYEEETIVSIIYDGITSGVTKVKGFYVNARDVKTMKFNVKSKPNSSLVDIDYFSHDLAKLKSMNMSCVAEFKGRIRLLKLFNGNKISVLSCTMTLNLTSHGVQNLVCQ